MGLDHWLFKAKKPTERQIELTEKRLEQNALKEITLLSAHDLVQNICPEVATPVTVMQTVFDYDLFEEDNNIPHDARLVYIGNSPVRNPYNEAIVDDVLTTFRYRCQDDSEIEATYTRNEAEHRYIVLESSPNNFLATCMEEVAQWRERDDIQDAVYDIMANHEVQIENCGFFLLTDDCVEAIKELDPTITGVTLGPKERFVYHEWY